MKFKNLLVKNHLANFNQTWHKAFLGEGESMFVKIKTPALFQGGII